MHCAFVQAAIQQAARQWPVQSMTPTTAADSVASALQQLQRDSQQQHLIVKHVKSIEAKLNALEGSVVTAGMCDLSPSVVCCAVCNSDMHSRLCTVTACSQRFAHCTMRIPRHATGMLMQYQTQSSLLLRKDHA